MPFKAIMHAEHDLVITVPHGEITNAELPAYYRERLAEGTLRAGLRELVDGRWIDRFDVSAAGQRELVDLLRDHPEQVEGVRWAFIADSPLAYGMFRMFEAQKSDLPFTTSVFGSPTEAAAWLEVPAEVMVNGRPQGGSR